MAAAEAGDGRLMRLLVLGCRGQLGSDLMAVIAAAGHTADGLDYPQVDITSPDSVAAALDRSGPDVVVNAAAYTAVDAAEDDEEAALAVNGHGPAVLARHIARLAGVRLIHISTDYVFPGDAEEPYAEDDPTGPRSAYGRTKLAGEQAVLGELPGRGYVVRTAWLYGEHGHNFVKTMLRLQAERESVAVVDDQIGQPTWSRDLAEQIVRLASSEAPAGVYHGTNSGSCSWYEFTREIFRLAGADPERVQPTTTDAFPRPAPRPAYSVLGHGAWSRVGIEPMRSWREAAAEGVPRIERAMQPSPDRS